MPLPSPTTAEPCDGLLRLRQVLAQASDFAGQLERGQARVPLRDHFVGLGTTLDAAALTVILLALDAESRAVAFRWWCGGREPVPQGHAASPAPRIEIQEGITVLLPTWPALLASQPALISRLLAESNLLLVAGPGGAELDATVSQAMQELASGTRATWLILCGGGDRPIPITRGWPALIGRSILAVSDLDPSAALPPSPLGLADGQRSLRACLSGLQHAFRLEASLPMLEDRLGQDIRQQETRRKTLLRRSASLAESEQDRDLREASTAIHRRLDEGLTHLEVRLAECFRERMLPTSTRSNQLKNLLEDLSAEDITEEAAVNAIQLGVSSDYLRNALRLLEEMVRDDQSADLQLLRDQVTKLAETTAASLSDLTGGPVSVRPTLPDAAAAWEATRKAIDLDFNYRAEAPRRGFFDLILQGRRPVIILTMSLSLAGAAFGAGSSLIARFAPLMLLVFFGALAWAVYQFRQERLERMEKELQRLRQALGAELKRLHEQVLRDWQGRVARHLKDVQRELVQQLDEPLRAHAAERVKNNARERVEIQEKLKIIDIRLREFAGLEQQFQRLRQGAAEARSALERAARAALEPQRADEGR